MFRHARSWTGAARRALLALGLASTVLTSTLGLPTTPDVAAESSSPSARLEILVKSVQIHDDREGLLSGEGEMAIYAGIWRCKEGAPPPCGGGAGVGESMPVKEMPRYAPHPIARATRLFEAGSGDTKTLDLPMPGAGDMVWGADTSPERGFAITAGEQYVLQFEMEEFDPANGEHMGYTYRIIDTGGHGLGIGTHTVRSRRDEGGATPGDFTITYEIRRVPLPDLKPVNIKVLDLPGNAKKQVCMAVQNVDVVHSSPFEVELKVDDERVPGGKYTIGLLASGTHFDACVIAALPATGQHKLSAVVDEAGAVTEFNEANNLYETLYKPGGSAATASESATAPAVTSTEPTTVEPETEPTTVEPTQTSTSSKVQPDLVVSAIKVNGRAPDGKDDCKHGKNDVTVVVKNQGTKKAGDFMVQLVMDGDQGGARQQGLDDGLEAGAERSVTFKGVTLKKGSHSLAVTADVTTGIAESNEDNNTRSVTASCKDDN